MKKIFKFISALFCALVLFISGCSCGVTPVAFVDMLHEEEEVVVYTSHANGGYPHIFVFEHEEDLPNADDYNQPADFRRAQEHNCAYYISFMPRQMGKMTVDDKDVITVDISSWYELTLVIIKDSYKNKTLYLNDEELTPYINTEDTVLSYKDFTLNRSNSNGKITNVINTLELK